MGGTARQNMGNVSEQGRIVRMSATSQYAAQGSYAQTSSKTRFTITAECLKGDGLTYASSTLSYPADDAGKIEDIANRDGQLVLVSRAGAPANSHNRLGRFVPPGSYQESCRKINLQIDSDCTKATSGSRQAQIKYDAEAARNLTDIANDDGSLRLVARPVGNALDEAKVKWTSAAEYDKLGIDESSLIGVTADGNTMVIGPGSSVSTVSVKGGVIVTKTLLGPKYSVIASEAVMRIASNGTVGHIDAVDVSILEAYAGADMAPLYAGAGVGFRLAGGSASIFDFDLGVGLTTGAGIKDNSVEVKLAGTGVTVGQKISISVFNNSFGLDLVRTAHAVGYVGGQLIVAVAVVPGALKNAGVSLATEFKSMPETFAKAGKDIGSEAAKIPGALASVPGQIWTGVVASVKGLTGH
jgi:hypothetical protein